MKRVNVLVFAGADPSGGAGIQADIQAIAALGAHALSVITVLTAQDNDHVYFAEPVDAEFVRRQAQALIDKMLISAVKIGIIGSRENAEAIAEIIGVLRLQHPDLPVVLDPVLASGHGDALAGEDAIQIMQPLLALATVITPNLPEVAALCTGDRRAESQADTLMQRGCRNVLIKGGHATDAKVVNRWFGKDGARSWSWPRLSGSFHGSGCTLASAIAALLAQGKSMEQALEAGQAFCHEALVQAYTIAPGQSIPNRSHARKAGQ
ncbi:MAG TPA: hydroxymethylpyrimidine/phosphomethylpyrimidine kinase [Burkholderiaceae bacterium]